jgi:DNA-binding transcriptional regulator YiaG
MVTTELPELLEAVNGATRSLRESKRGVPPDVSNLVDRFDSLLHAEAPLNLGVDPYLSTALFAGALRSMKALRHDNAMQQRRDLRLALEQVRHALRDIVDAHWVSEETPVGEVLDALVATLRLPQPELAHLLGISTRQLQRWLANDDALPSGHEESRVRMVAQLVNQLRHVYTAQGVPAWFEYKGPGMTATPLELLADPINFPELLEAARGARGAP